MSHIGLLDKVINHSRTYNQGGGSIFERVEKQIYKEARNHGHSSFKTNFTNTYNFKPMLFSFGTSTVEGDININVTEKGEFLHINASIDYTFWDEYKDPADVLNVIPGETEMPGGKPYKILGVWSTKLEATIRKDISKSRYK